MALHSWGKKGRRSIRRARKKRICEICGDIGFQKDIATCNRCKDVDVHRYCVLGYFVPPPVNWFCEKCDTGKRVISSLCRIENDYSEGSKIHPSAKISQSTLPPKQRMRPPGWHCINWEKEVQTGKTKYIPVKEALGLPTSVTKYGHQQKKTVFSRNAATKSMATETRGKVKPRTQISTSFPEKRTMQYSSGSAGYKPHNFSAIRITEPSKKQVQSSKGPDGPTVLKLRSPDAVKASEMMNPIMTHPCDPALDHSWKGSFDIFNAPEIVPRLLNNCIQAHPPSKVRRKVYEYSHLLPDTLKFRLDPRGKIWAGLFNNHIPGKEDIGLYFFASEKERSEVYISLVEFMCREDLVIRTLTNDVELLILPSTALRSDSQRWNNKHFLWGLFYSMKKDTDGSAEGGSNIVTDGCAEGGSNKVIDMEIDMIAGEM